MQKPIPDVPEPWYPIGDAATYLKVHSKTVRRYVNSGQLPAHKLPGGGLRFKQSDLDALLRPVPAAKSA